jgi:uncharacterized protein YjbI with pentapeptide repeats
MRDSPKDEHEIPSTEGVLPKVEPLLVHSERTLLLAMVKAFGGTAMEFDSAAPELFKHVTTLLSAGIHENLLTDEHRARLALIGFRILGPRVMADDGISSQSWDAADWWLQPKESWLVSPSSLSVAEQWDQKINDWKTANHPQVYRCAMVGLLALRIITFGFDPGAEETLDSLGGGTEIFRKTVADEDGQIEFGTDMSSVLAKRSVDESVFFSRNFGSFKIWELKSGISVSVGILGHPSWIEGTRECPESWVIKSLSGLEIPLSGTEEHEISALFDGLTKYQVEELLKDIDSTQRDRIISSIERRHEKLAEAPPVDPTRDRRILTGAHFWKSNLPPQLPLPFLNHLDLRNFSFEGANLKNKELVGCLLRGAILRRADCSGAVMRGCDFGEANLSYAWFYRTDLSGADLSKANLSYARFYEWEPDSNPLTYHIRYFVNRGHRVEGAAIFDRFTRLLGIEWGDPRYSPTAEEVAAQKARFKGWSQDDFNDLTSPLGPFRLGTLQKSALRRLAKIFFEPSPSSLFKPNSQPFAKAADFLPPTVFYPEEVLGSFPALRSMADPANLPLIKGAHPNADFTDKGRFSLRGGFIEDASLVNANMTGQDLEGAVISNSDLSGANLQRVNLRGATLVNVDLSGADLSGADLTETNFVNCNFEGANLNGVSMINCQIQQCTIKDVTITEGVIEGLILCQSFVHHVSFSGDQEGSGVIVGGIGFYDSIVMDAQFSGNTTVDEIELAGSLFVGSGPGILKAENCIVGQGSEWRDQVVQTASDAVLGQVLSQLRLEPSRGDGKGRTPSQAPDGSNPASILLTEVFCTRSGLLGEVPVLDHLRGLRIGYQGRAPLTEEAGYRKLILPVPR